MCPVTESQLAHRAEQLQAARRDFAQLWNLELWQHVIALGAKTPQELLAIETVAWHAFPAGQQSNQTPPT
jgi:hypothetical protein